MAAEGRGYRPLAAALGLPESTVRSWLRRLRARVDVLRGWFGWFGGGDGGGAAASAACVLGAGAAGAGDR
ncbi:MAG: helix-turn-helix domain-containing protein [Solirubrobacteraceae bacterium]